MIKAKDECNEFGCNCGKLCSSMEHSLTCPRRSIFLLTNPTNKDRLEEAFIGFGYSPSVTLPNLDSIKEFGDELAEMMKCDCGHWFPRWQYYRCPSCWKGH